MDRQFPNSSKKNLASSRSTLNKLADIELNVLKKLNIKKKYAEIALLSNREMEKIRSELILRPDFRGPEARKIKNEESVNVLSFPDPGGFPEPEAGLKKLGEIYINKDMTKGDFDQISYLFIHGLLHLLGYDHLTKRDSIQMEKLEKELWLHVFSSV